MPLDPKVRDHLRQFEKGKKIPPDKKQQYYRNCRVKEELKDDETYNQMTQEEKNNYYKSIEK